MSSRLLGRLRKAEKVEAVAEQRRRVRRMRPTGVVWMTVDGEAVEADEGEEVVIDYYILSVSPGATTARCVERLTSDPDDRGRVFGSDGAPLGFVLRRDGHVVELDFDRAAVAPPREDAYESGVRFERRDGAGDGG